MGMVLAGIVSRDRGNNTNNGYVTAPSTPGSFSGTATLTSDYKRSATSIVILSLPAR